MCVCFPKPLYFIGVERQKEGSHSGHGACNINSIALVILDIPDRVRSTQNGRMVCGVGRLLFSVDICIHVVVKDDVKRNLPITNLFITLHKQSQLT